MSINSNYATPVSVNGFTCRNCTDVDYAKKHIDPEHPKSGPYGIDAKDDPTVHASQTVTFGGALNGLNSASKNGAQTGGQPVNSGQTPPPFGQALDISV